MESVEDLSLLEAFSRSRSETSFRELYRAHSPVLFAMALRLSGSRPQAEELVQEAWVRAIERLDRFRRASSFRTWLCGILINCHREHDRRRGRDPRSLAGATSREERGALASPARPHETSRRVARLDAQRAIHRLPTGYREVLVLHDIHGYTHREIGRLLDIEEGTSKSQLARGRRRLRSLLGDHREPRKRERR